MQGPIDVIKTDPGDANLDDFDVLPHFGLEDDHTGTMAADSDQPLSLAANDVGQDDAEDSTFPVEMFDNHPDSQLLDVLDAMDASPEGFLPEPPSGDSDDDSSDSEYDSEERAFELSMLPMGEQSWMMPTSLLMNRIPKSYAMVSQVCTLQITIWIASHAIATWTPRRHGNCLG